MFRRLLVPLDGARLSEAVLPMAAFLAQRSGARVTLLHVVEQRAPSKVHGDRHLTTAEEAGQYLAEVARRHFPASATVDWHVHRREIADVAHSLADHADELESDLVVMLAHGHGDLRRWLSGTLAQQVLRQAPTPILFLRPDAKGQITVPFHCILVPLDGQAHHESGLPVAATLARLASAAVQILMVVPTFTTLGGVHAASGQLLPSATREILDLAEREGAEYLQRHLERLKQEGIVVSAAVARGEPASVIPAIAESFHADLVVLGTHGSAGIEAFWAASVGQKLFDRIPVSFLFAPAAAEK